MSHLDADAPDGITGHGRNIPADMPDGGSVRGSGGWCAPSDVVRQLGEIPEVTVKRGGLQWGASTHESDCAKVFDAGARCDCGTAEEFDAEDESGEYETEREAATRERWRTARVIAALLFVAYVLTMLNQSLPWQ